MHLQRWTSTRTRHLRDLRCEEMLMRCECCDTNCPAHKGQKCGSDATYHTLYRADMYDPIGTLFCEPCTEDALESGLFATEDVEE